MTSSTGAPSSATRSASVFAPDALARWRDDTPGCAHRNHLNNAGAALMPRPVVDAVRSHITFESQIGGYEAADAREAQSEAPYEALARVVGAEQGALAVIVTPT